MTSPNFLGDRGARDFVKLYLIVIRPVGGGTNVLPEVPRGSFGPTAGANGTRLEVQFERRDGRWAMTPGGQGVGGFVARSDKFTR